MGQVAYDFRDDVVLVTGGSRGLGRDFVNNAGVHAGAKSW